MNEPSTTYVMKNDELCDALMYANACLKSCAEDVRPLWLMHIKRLMDIQEGRAAALHVSFPAE
jgi:hypothetical protein